MAAPVVCCTCATVLNAKPPKYSHDSSTRISYNTKATSSEKSSRSPPNYEFSPPQTAIVSRQLPCCNRTICSKCTTKNPRFETYCPFCQISTAASSLPQGLRDPPPYDSKPPSPKRSNLREDGMTQEDPPAYSSVISASSASTSQRRQEQQDVIHHLRPNDTMQSLSLAYGVPAAILRSHNTLFSDSLLPARRTVAIPASHYTGPSLSAESPDSPEEAARKAALRRFMLATKCAEYSVAELYLSHAKGNPEAAIEAWRDDERWEHENPMQSGSMSRLGAVRRQGPRENARSRRQNGGGGGGLTGQLR